MPLIGTAGHVDHGKSTLIQTLTGRDPDRWREEKDRGLTIDLGFAWATLPSGTEVSFVDVPGHERYMRNMLAGVEAVDIALLVVAADESWMPQTEEHLAVLDALGVKSGLVALTKTDVVDDDLVELAGLEVEERLNGTSLAGTAIIPVSAKTGAGIPELLAEIDRFVSEGVTRDDGRPRLWIDRSFPIAGAGTIVTGSQLGGVFSIDTRVTVYPEGVEARIRSIQSHERDVEAIGPGNRAALNLSGVDHSDLTRGQMIGLAGQWDPTTRFSAQIRPSRYAEEISTKGDYTVHAGSGAQRAKIIGVANGTAVIAIDSPMTLTGGDRFIIRDTGRKLVVGGGRVVDVAPPKTSAAVSLAQTLDPDFDSDSLASKLLGQRGSDSATRLAAHTSGGTAQDGHAVGDDVLDPAHCDLLRGSAAAAVATFHREFPLRDGIPMATLAERLGVSIDITEHVADEAGLSRSGPAVSEPGFEGFPTPTQKEKWDETVSRLGEGLDVPSSDDLSVDQEMLGYLLRKGNLVRVSDTLVFLPSQIDELTTIARSLDDEFTVAQFRDSTGLSRKYAVPILEWMDKEGLTFRRGDRRSFR